MAVRTRIAVEFGEVFPRGALVLGVEPVQDFEKMQAKAADPQERDKETGERVWLVRVVDLDTENQRKGTAEVGVKITAPHQPLPPSRAGLPAAGGGVRRADRHAVRRLAEVLGSRRPVPVPAGVLAARCRPARAGGAGPQVGPGRLIGRPAC